MVVKFFGNRNGGGVSSINYLLDKRKENGTARILQGDEQVTRNLILSLTQKHKVCVGCLSFEEQNIDEDLKKELMESFENMLLTPAMGGRYNILWIEHTDKGRLELNFVIPKIDLESKKSFNPYFHKADFKRKDLWTDFVNLKHNFTNPKDPAKENTIQGSKKEKELIRDYETLDQILHEYVKKGTLTSRNAIVDFLKFNEIEVTRQGKDYISIKLPQAQKAKRFKGGIYEEQFSSIAKLSEISREHRERERAFIERDSPKEFARLKRELDHFIHAKYEFYTELHNKRTARKNQSDFPENKNHSDELLERNASSGNFKRNSLVSIGETLPSIEIEHKRNATGGFYSATQNREHRARRIDSDADTIGRENDNIRKRINDRSREITNRARIYAEERIRITGNAGERDKKNTELRERFKKLIGDFQTEFESRTRKNRTFIAEFKERFSEFANAVRNIAERARELIRLKSNQNINIQKIEADKQVQKEINKQVKKSKTRGFRI